jgi:hypothetical protein
MALTNCFGQCQAPGVAVAQIHLLEILVQAAFGKQVALGPGFIGQQRHLRQLRRTLQARELWILPAWQHRPAFRQQVVAAQSFVAAEQSGGLG